MEKIQAIFLLFLSSIVAISSFPTNGVVSTEWLNDNLNDPSLRILNAGQFLAFTQSRIPGATHLRLGSKLKDEKLYNTLIDGAVFENAVSKAGISNDNKVVVYSTTSSKVATRTWWVFKRFGMDVAILDGGFQKWKAEGYEVDNNDPIARQPGTFKRDEIDGVLVTMQDLEATLKNDDALIVDVRTPDEYNGVRVKNKRGGHVPGAINIPHTDFLDEDKGTFLADDELKDIARSAGLPDPENAKKIVTYCQSGVRATLAALALEKIGYDVAVYERSMLEWQNEKETPLE
uniref:Rhodanese domain-containing protein n=1 Tax=Palpitomonas bilix TaxID=652834 RepID=A0A7S3CZI4_9EUKA|mmetsp:Transcript_15918/g.40302  ORF Transcript_15918/g.40302 Transcript_15918/m.40302 type:complete len:289 (+) Transcript_15918:95-961(+)|eukprot:CAMPEP_0113889106 /NCGR_PEP_ID=MMETSP0780_2-20120614/13285_1 /TAXON_ID=652834 /ORGANISM="Palpitomonas bilix" /LENGTH=288 /DNA_ID=CAMNT_0000878113 /DNA_START=44 /DNA_END=910 /DNA_ORIENTATION=- /assembly_acc=CAM_ASM_000599